MDNKIYEMEIVEMDQMTRWVRFSDRLPTVEDFLPTGELIILGEEGIETAICKVDALESVRDLYSECFWLENVPELPKPRTLEEVARDLFITGFDFDWHILTAEVRGLLNEMRDILEKGKGQ